MHSPCQRNESSCSYHDSELQKIQRHWLFLKMEQVIFDPVATVRTQNILCVLDFPENITSQVPFADIKLNYGARQ